MVDNLANALFFALSRDIYNSLLTFPTRDSAERIYLHRYYLHIVRRTPLELAMIEKATRPHQKKKTQVTSNHTKKPHRIYLPSQHLLQQARACIPSLGPSGDNQNLPNELHQGIPLGI